MQDRIQKYSDVSKQPVLHTGSVQCTLQTYACLFTQIKAESRKIKLMSGTAGDVFRVGTIFFTVRSFSFCMYISACQT